MLLDLIKEKDVDVGIAPAARAPATFSEIFDLSAQDYWANERSTSGFVVRDEVQQERDTLFREADGREVTDLELPEAPQEGMPEAFAVKQQRDKAVDDYILEKRNQGISAFDNIRTSAEIEQEAIRRAQTVRKDLGEALATRGSAVGFTASLAGAGWNALSDPLTIATLPLGAARGASVLRTIATEAAIGAGTEAIKAPLIAEWRKTTGQDLTLEEIISNVGFGGLLGGTVGGVIAGGAPAYRAALHQLEKYGYIKARNPIADAVNDTTPIHFEAVKKASEVLEAGRTLTREDLGNLPPIYREREATFKRKDFEKSNIAELDQSLRDLRAEISRQEKEYKQALKKPVVNYVKKKGGVSPDGSIAADLRSIGFNSKNAVGLFRKTGAGELDNIPANEFRQATGIEPETDGNYVSISWLRDKLREELFQEPVIKSNKYADEFIAELQDYGLTSKATGKELYSARNQKLLSNIKDYAEQSGYEFTQDDLDFALEQVVSKNISDYRIATEYTQNVKDDILATGELEPQINGMPLREFEDLDFADAEMAGFTPPITQTIDELDLIPLATTDPQLNAALDVDIARILEDMPDMMVTLDDKQLPLSQLLDEIAEDEQAAKAITNCAVG